MCLLQKSINLEYKLSQGDNYQFTTDIDMDMTFEAMGQTTTMNQLMGIQMTSIVTSIEDNDINQDFTFDKIAMNQKIFGMEINYDSEDSSTFNSGMGAQIATEMNKIIGATIKISMDKYGTINELNISSITSNSDLVNSFGSGNMYAVYPKHKIKVGESWEEDINPPKSSEMKVHVKYTLVKATKKQVDIDIEGTISANEIEGNEINLSGTTTGKMIVDRATGMLIQSTIDSEIEMDLEKGGNKIPATMMSTSITNVKKIN